MGKTNPLSQEINFIISVLFIGSAALFAIITVIRFTGNDNPLERLVTSQQPMGEGEVF